MRVTFFVPAAPAENVPVYSIEKGHNSLVVLPIELVRSGDVYFLDGPIRIRIQALCSLGSACQFQLKKFQCKNGKKYKTSKNTLFYLLQCVLGLLVRFNHSYSDGWLTMITRHRT